MTDSDWIAFENLLRVTWYYYPNEKRTPRNPNYTKPLWSEIVCNSCHRTSKEIPVLWIESELDRLKNIFLCEKCLEILTKLIDILKIIPKAEKYFDEKIVEENKRKQKLQGIQILHSSIRWLVPDIQRRFLKEELK